MSSQGTATVAPESTAEQQRLIAILHYLEDWDRLSRTPIGSVRDYRAGLVFFEEEAAHLPDLKFNLIGVLNCCPAFFAIQMSQPWISFRTTAQRVK